MPGNLLFADKQFPNVTGNNENDLKAVLNYMYMLQEQLRYTLGNISTENLNENDFIVQAANIDYGGTTEIDGDMVKAETLYAHALGANEVTTGYRWLSALNGMNFADSNLVDYTSADYAPENNRSLNGLHSLRFNGDLVLDGTGRGTTGNGVTASETGHIMNWQSATGTVTQMGMRVGSVNNLLLYGQVYGQVTGLAVGVIICNVNPDTVTSGNSYCQIQIVDSGIIVGRYKKESDGTWTTLSETTLIS